ncbi:hypothetical protein GCM10010517_07910 [Streptosporangium fragile]|uniref:Uncharacterized protein n=1 Tax=Streptosporangium fragile TaxID=46186 RepID=A0ABN3VRX0_9ACTN
MSSGPRERDATEGGEIDIGALDLLSATEEARLWPCADTVRCTWWAGFTKM